MALGLPLNINQTSFMVLVVIEAFCQIISLIPVGVREGQGFICLPKGK